MYENGSDVGVILVLGGKGQLGRELARRSGDVVAPSSAELDITDPAAVDPAVASASAVINAAAYTAVDRAEDDRDRAFAVNAEGPLILASACARYDIPLIQVSTDYVFSGDATQPYETTDPTLPRTVYGQSKLLGEHNVLHTWHKSWVVRTSWLYGGGSGNFVTAIIKLEKTREHLSVVDDQRGSPTWAGDLADGLLELLKRQPSARLLHATNSGEATRYDFARAIFRELGTDPDRIKPCATADFPARAPRPAYSVLANTAWRAAGLTPLADWQSALRKFFATRLHWSAADAEW